MLSNFPVEIILMSLDYLKFEEIEALAWTSKRIMSIVRRNIPMALQPKVLVNHLTISPLEPHDVGLKIMVCIFLRG